MAKRFMFVCIGIFALAGAFHLGAQYGNAEYVDPFSTGIVAHWDGSQRFALLDNGEVWSFKLSPPQGWVREDIRYDPPVQVSQVKFISDFLVIDAGNQAWYYSEPAGWVNYGPPTGGVATEPSTWGNIKSKWYEEE